MQNFWMNETSSTQWGERTVGIVRVERELLNHLTPKRFRVTSNSIIPSSDDKAQVNTLKEKTSSFQGQDIQWLKAKAFLIGARTLPRHNRLTKGLGYLFAWMYDGKYLKSETLNLILNHFYRINLFIVKKKQKSNSTRKFSAPSTEGKSFVKKISHPFHDGDIVLSAGLDWDVGLVDKILEIKKSTDIYFVGVVYDLIPIDNPEYLVDSRHADFLLGYFVKLMLCVDLLIVNTEFTKQRLIAFCKKSGIKMPKSTIVKWGALDSAKVSPREVAEISGGENFLMAVGTFEIRKNYQLLFNLAHISEKEKINIPKIYIVGTRGWGTNDLVLQLQSNETLKRKIVWLEEVSDAELLWMYQNAKALLSPSFAEGFGLPIIEALKNGCPVLLSDIEVYRELFPNAQFANPYSPREWLEKIKNGIPLLSTSVPIENWNAVATQIKFAISKETKIRL